MKKNIRLATLVAIVSLTISKSAFAITANATAIIAAAMGVSESTAMNFGTVDSSGTSGAITTAGAVSGGVTDFDATGRAAASFSVTGEANSSYTFNLPATATLDDGGAGDAMTVTLSFASGSSSRTLSSGAETVAVNGSLAVAANQLAATYTGTYTVTVEY